MWGHQVRRVHQTETSEAYTGWTRQILVDSNHRWRFQRFLKGWLVEQVSYYADGTADHHFHTDTLGRNVGSQRMWRDEGQPYLDQFHDTQGRLHGRQIRWNADGRTPASTTAPKSTPKAAPSPRTSAPSQAEMETGADTQSAVRTTISSKKSQLSAPAAACQSGQAPALTAVIRTNRAS